MKYAHLTRDERYQIAILLKAGHKQRDIARIMNRHPSTISRELRRNRGQRGYRPKQAHEFSQARTQARDNGRRISADTWAFVEARLAELWSPEQISGYLKANGQPGISHETIYRHIYADRRAGGDLHRALRCQKARRKRYGGRDRRGIIPNQVSIEQRPAIVDARRRFGDWEADLVIGAAHRQALVTLNERKSRYALIAHVPDKTAEAVSSAMISMLEPIKACVHTLTTDNGREFAGHERIARALDADFYFAHPYASWERGANENLNGLIRQFFPKKLRFDSITPHQVAFAMHRLNHRPRKCLGFKTPHEVFMTQLKSRLNVVALQS
jgi:IS30 family transposase